MYKRTKGYANGGKVKSKGMKNGGMRKSKGMPEEAPSSFPIDLM